MKKIAAIMLILASLASFASCGNGSNGNDTSNDTSVSDSTGDTSAADNTDTETEAPDTEAPAADVATADILAAVAEEFGDDYLPNMDIPADYLDSTYGVKADWYDEFSGQIPMIGANVDTFIAIKAKADNVSDVENALNDYAAYYRTDAFKYPKDIAKAEACRVYTKGNYVFFIMLGVPTDEVENSEDADQVKFYTEQNDRAVKVIDSLLG